MAHKNGLFTVTPASSVGKACPSILAALNLALRGGVV
jgi:hypothetical protein